ncbi:MAG: M3 family metallopeptidase [Bacteroidales bacterium]|nr:M3 family metallopeptidase [Bacteroidales bacterium]
MSNPLLSKFDTPFEAAPFDRVKPEHYIPAIETLIDEADKDIQAIAKQSEQPDFENTIDALEDNGEKLGRAVEILFNLNQAETNEELQKITQEVSPKLSEFSSRMLMNEDLFKRIKYIYDNASDNDNSNLTTEQHTVLTNYYDNFIRNGAELEGSKKKRFAAIKSELATLTLTFSDHVLAETNAFFLHLSDEKDLKGLPDFVREAAANEAKARELDGWVFTLHYPSFVPFMKYSSIRQLRKKMFMAFTFRANQNNENDNKELIQKIVNLRLELAQIMGEKNYASYVLKKRMAEKPETVNEFIESLHKASRPYALKEFDEVQQMANENGHEGAVERWDWAFWSETLRKAKYDISDEEVKPYFELSRVSQGVFDLATSLYKMRFEPSDDIPVYHSEVKVYKVFDENSDFLSLVYLDFFPRKGKQGGAWMTDFRGQDNLGGRNVRPHVSIVCNFTRPTDDKPSLLTFDEVNTFLHEFGHALHGMLSKCVYPSVSGTNVFRDFVELPSQLMENWITEKEWLDKVAIHYQTSEKMPDALLQKLIDARNFQAGYLSERQLSFGFNDMAWHSITEPFDSDVIAFEKNAMARTELFPKVKDACMSTAFSHIFAGGYAAGYYGYKWAEVLDADAFSLFKEKGIFNKEVAASFRENVLEKGGSEPPMILYKNFRGQEPGIQPLLKRSGLTNTTPTP